MRYAITADPSRSRSHVLRSHRLASLCTAEALERRVMLSQVVPVGPEFRVDDFPLVAGRPAVAMSHTGSFLVAWESEGDGSGYGIYARHYSAARMPQVDEFRVNTYTVGHQRSPAVAMDAHGNFVVAWESRSQDGSEYGVYAQRFNAAGIPVGDEFLVNTYTPFDQRFPSVAMSTDGDFVVAWQGFQPLNAGIDIFAQCYDAGGAPLSGEFRVNSISTLNQRHPSVAMDADGDFVVAWEGLDGSEQGIKAQRFSAHGVPQSPEFLVNTFTYTGERGPSVAMDAAGNFVVTWWSEDQDGSGAGGFAQRYGADGLPQGTEFQVSTYTTNNQRQPAVAMGAATGDFVITWYSEGQDGSLGGTFAQRYDAEGTPQGPEFRANTYTTGNQSHYMDGPTVAMDAAGNFVVAWPGVGASSGGGIFAQRYAIVPEVTSSSFLFDSSPHRLRYRFNHDVRESLGAGDLIVENLTTGQAFPAADFALLYDPASNVATFIYLGAGSESIAGVLPDGRYRATLLAEGIVTPQGASPAADHELEFYFLNGDANRDGLVNLADFNILARNFGQSGTDFSRGDFTFDGATDLDDFNLFAARFGAALPGALARTTYLPIFGPHTDDVERLDDVLR